MTLRESSASYASAMTFYCVHDSMLYESQLQVAMINSLYVPLLLANTPNDNFSTTSLVAKAKVMHGL